MYTVLLALHVVISLALIAVVLVQSSKGGGLAGAFGGGGGLPQQMFGSRAVSSALTKITVYLAVGFFMTSAVLFIMTADRTVAPGSAVQRALEEGSLGEQMLPPPSDEVFDPTTPMTGEEAATPDATGDDAQPTGDVEESTAP